MLRSGIPACSLQDRITPTRPDGKTARSAYSELRLFKFRHRKFFVVAVSPLIAFVVPSSDMH